MDRDRQAAVARRANVLVARVLRVPFDPHLLPSDDRPNIFRIVGRFRQDARDRASAFLVDLRSLVICTRHFFWFLWEAVIGATTNGQYGFFRVVPTRHDGDGVSFLLRRDVAAFGGRLKEGGPLWYQT